MKLRKYIAFIWIVLAFPALAQLPPGQYTTANKKAIRHLQEGKKALEYKQDAEAERSFKKALEEEKNFVEAALGLADLYQLTGRDSLAIIYFRRAIEINPGFFHNAFYFLSQSQLRLGKYEDAKQSLETFLKAQRINPNTKDNARKLLEIASFGAEAVKNPKPFKSANVGEGINSEHDEYFPALTADGKSFLFTRGMRIPEEGNYLNEDFYISNKVDETWQTAQPIREVNSHGNEGAPTLSADGKIMFFVSCADEFGNYGAADRKGYGSCDIFYSQKVDGRWSRPRNAGAAINSANWETQPSFSSDGKTLYFVRGVVNRGSIREQDIYMSTINQEGKFTQAVKLSTVVNTPYKEESVFIHPDNQTLYFSSEGHPGMGGLDIFMTRRQADGSWSKPENLGYPINSFKDDISLLVDPSGALAFYASDGQGGYGGLDIFQFEMPEEFRPEKITYVKGKIYDARTKETLEANFELIDLETRQVVSNSTTQKDGQFFATLTANKNYAVNVNRPGYLFYSDNFRLKEVQADLDKPFLLDIPLEPIDTGSIVELKNIFFDVDKWELKPQSQVELEKLTDLLVKNPSLKIQISGHTDNSGDKKSNVTLSMNRAKAVYDYLAAHGIAATRLSYKGYGDSQPKVPNDSPENKAKNRRTEFKVLAR